MQFTDEGRLSISYWTLIGAYFAKGEKNDTHTLMDASVFHIPSRKMLFRAPGVSQIRGAATPINLNEQLRNDSILGFQEASKDLVTNLQAQLEAFKEKVKESPEEFQIIRRQSMGRGSTGGGSVDALVLFLIAFLGIYPLWPKKR